MKKIFAILLALAVVSMAFAQTVEVSNTLKSEPVFSVGNTNWVNDGTTTWTNGQWGFADNNFLRDEIDGKGTTADGRAAIWGNVKFDVRPYAAENNLPDGTGTVLANLVTGTSSNFALNNRWNFVASWEANAFLKPLEFLGVGVGTSIGGGVCGTASFGPGLAWEGSYAPGAKADTQKLFNFLNGDKGAYVAFLGDGLGINGLTVAAGIGSESWIKKEVASFAVGVKYANDIFEAGAKWEGSFGAAYVNNGNFFNKTETALTPRAGLVVNKAWSTNVFYVGGTFKGLQDLPVGITIDAAASFVMNKSERSTTDAAFTVDANFDFKNGITTKPAVTVGFNSGYPTNYKMLPFYVGNTLTYKPSDDMQFSLLTGYAQSGYDYTLTNAPVAAYNGSTRASRIGSSLTLKPAFEFTMGASTFAFAVKSQIDGHLSNSEKTDFDWASTTIHTDYAKVSFPVSWKYKF